MPYNHKNRNQNLPGLLAKIRGVIGLNIGTVLFGVLFLYMLFSAILYLTSSKVESYQVISGPLSRNETYTGLAIREETVYTAQADGYITYYAREGTKIAANGAVFGISSSKTENTESTLSADDLSEIRSQMLSFSRGFNPSKFNNTYSFKYGLEGSILQYAGVTGSSSEDEDGSGSVISYGGQSISTSATDGIVLYSTDGYEGKTTDTLSAEDFDQNAYHETDLKTEEKVSAGDEIYSLITDERWSLVIPLSDKQASKLDDRTAVKVKFLKDDKTQSGDFSIIEIDGAKYGKIDFSKGLIRYASDRFLEIELVTNTVTGLKIPLTSIVTKEFYTIPAKYAATSDDGGDTGFMVESKGKDGEETLTFVEATIYASMDTSTSVLLDEEDETGDDTVYYVNKDKFDEGDIIVSQEDDSKYTVHDVGVLEGVYCMNQGYAVFRRIELLDQNEEYAIVATGTSYGLSRYDHIVRNADAVDEEEILY